MRSLAIALALTSLACGRGRFTADEVGNDTVAGEGSDASDAGDESSSSAEQLGPEYRMGEHHDGGGGWNWWAEADLEIVTPEAGRFWVAIANQPGNCWNWSP
jgi:hypothetical protein